MQPLKVLCLHGFMQNGTTFRLRTGSFRKVCSPLLRPTHAHRPTLLHRRSKTATSFSPMRRILLLKFCSSRHPVMKLLLQVTFYLQRFGSYQHVVFLWVEAAEDDVGGAAARAWYGWHPNRESCVSFTGIEQSLQLIMEVSA
jgi:hypothetical protein